ncbi:MAG: polysaccharide deacetylase family protein [Methylococcaceae bacterium]|nr:polysaccharide deacetylase family protein [Methylococcaceae bacterium]
MSSALPPQKPKVSVLMYHNVGAFEYPGGCMHNDCAIGRFKAQMAFLKRFGYRVIGLKQAVEGLFGASELPDKAVVLTFDDGYRDFHRQVFPVLQEYGFPACIYMVSGMVGQSALWLKERGLNAPLMEAADLREIHSSGIAIGSHTVNHVHLDQVSGERMREEIFDSKSALEQMIGAPVEHFCYPYGDYNPQVRDTVIEAGYRSATCSTRGAANFSSHPFEILRKNIVYGDHLGRFFWKLNLKHKRKERR